MNKINISGVIEMGQKNNNLIKNTIQTFVTQKNTKSLLENPLFVFDRPGNWWNPVGEGICKLADVGSFGEGWVQVMSRDGHGDGVLRLYSGL